MPSDWFLDSFLDESIVELAHLLMIRRWANSTSHWSSTRFAKSSSCCSLRFRQLRKKIRDFFFQNSEILENSGIFIIRFPDFLNFHAVAHGRLCHWHGVCCKICLHNSRFQCPWRSVTILPRPAVSGDKLLMSLLIQIRTKISFNLVKYGILFMQPMHSKSMLQSLNTSRRASPGNNIIARRLG